MTLWDAAVSTLFDVEGGHVDDPRDPGGETKFGISKRAYPLENIRELTRDDAALIYRRDYWNPLPADLPDDLRWMAFDSAVNHGVKTAIGWLEGRDTLASYTARRLAFYASLTQWPVYGKGWVRRVSTVLEGIDAWVSEHGRTEAVPTVVLHGLRLADRWVALATGPVVLRGRFIVTSRPGKVDVRRA